MQLNLQRARSVSQQEGKRFRQLNLQRPVSCWAAQGVPREMSRADCTWSPGTHAPPLAYPEGCSVPFAQYLRCCCPRIPFLLCSWDRFEWPGSTIKVPKVSNDITSYKKNYACKNVWIWRNNTYIDFVHESKQMQNSQINWLENVQSTLGPYVQKKCRLG